MCDCFHLAFPNWHAAPSGTAGRRLRAPEPATQDDSICEEPTQFAEGERPRPQGSSPVQEYPEAAKYADKEEAPSPEGGVIVNTAQDGCAEGLVYGGGGKDGIFIKKVVPESPASKSLKVKEGDQILSATVYFDNMSYEDAIQILEHAQAYKLKLCLKRQPDITETEPTIDSDVIPEGEVSSTEMREQGKTRRRGDARISWPKFPSFGKGRKSRFTRSHSSSEADEQRKLELSPTTSDTESPIKSQVALKGKKKHKIKLSGLTRRGRISSSEDQDTDAPTSGQMSSDVQQKQESDTLSPEFPEYPIAETPEINEQAGEAVESGPVQHKVELVSVDATLKTADQTVVLGDQEGQSAAPKSPDEKKKKKERSDLKIKILGKDKSHKKDAKAKSSPKRLKTLGASVETEDLPEAGKSAAISSSESKTKLLGDQSTVGVDSKNQGGESSKLISSKSITSQISLPKVELDLSVRKSPKKGDDKTQKGKETKQKQSKKSSPKRKRPELDVSNVANAEEMQKVSDQEPTTITGCVSTTQLPKREDIEIPGMEDMSVKTTVETKADFKKRNKESKAETVQMSIDVDSVKEAVSKLPGFKLPQLDISGVPIPEEITVIDANAQRISVKTPTKVTKPKQEHMTSSDTTASSEISKTIFLTDSRFDFKKSQMEDSTSPTKCKGEEETKEKEFDTTNGKAATTEELKTSTRPKITMPSFGMSAKSRRLPYIGIDMQKPSFIQEKELTMETRKDERQTGEVICKVKIPELDGIEYIDSTDELFKKDGGLTSFNVSTDTKTILAISLESKETSDKPEDERNKLSKVGLSPLGTPSGKEDISDEGTTKPLDRDGKSTFKWPNLDISVPKIKGTTVINTSKKDTAHTEAPAKGGLIPEGDTLLKSSDVPKEIAEAEKPQMEIKPTKTEGEFDWEASKFEKFGIKTPKIKGPEFDLSLSKKEVHGKAAGKLPEASKTEVTPGKGNVYFLKQKMQLEKPGEVNPLQSKGEHVQGGKIKIPKFGVKTTKLAGPEISLSKKDAEVTLPEAKTEIKLTEGSETDVNKDSVRPQEKKGIEKSDLKIKTVQKGGEAKGHKIKMPQLGIALPKVTTHESDLSLSKKGKDLTLPEVKGEIKDLEVEGTGSSTKLDVGAPGIKVETKDVEGSSSKFKMSPFKIPRIGAATPILSGEVSEASETHTVEDGPGIDATIPDSDVKIKASEIDGRASKFKIPKFGISLPKLKGSETDTTQSQKVDVDVTLFKGETEIKLIDAEHEEPGIRLKGKFPQIGVQQDVEYSTSKPEIAMPFSDAKAEVKLSQVDGEKINFSSPVVLIETPVLEIPTMKTENHLDGQEEKIQLSKIEIKMPKMKGPEFKLGLSSKDTDVMEAEGKVDNKAKAEVPVPTADVSLGKAEILIPSERVEVGKPEVQTQPTVEGPGGRFKMPKFGITMPKVKGPEAKRDVEVKLTEKKTDIKISDADFEAPDVEQSPSKFSMPTFKLPKLGLGTSNKNVEGDDIDKDIPDEVLEVTIVAPSSDLSNIDADTHLLESKTEVALSSDDVNKYSIEEEATAPQIKVSKKEKEGSPSKFKMPTFKLPKFGLSVQSSTEEEPPLDKDLKTGEGEITTSGEILVGSLEAPRIDIKAPSVALKTTGTESEGRGRKFKLPSLGFSASQTKGPDTDITLPTTDDVTLPTTDVDVTVPQVKTEIKRPEEKFNKSFEVEAKAPEFKRTKKETEGSPSKYKMPTFKMPKFGLSVQSSTAEVPPLDKDLKTGEGEITTSGEILVGSLEEPSIDVKAPSVDLKSTETESEGRGRKFKLPSLGFSASQTKGPDTDITLPTTDVDVTVPEVKAEIKVPEERFNKSFEVEAKAPEFKGTKIETEGSPSKYKMPTFKMPKFGLSIQSSTAEVPPLDKDLKTTGGEMTMSEEVIVVSTEGPSVEIGDLSIESKKQESEREGKGKRFKLPSLGFSATQAKVPDTGLSLKTGVDVTQPELKAEVKFPDDELKRIETVIETKGPEFQVEAKDIEGSTSKFKMPTFKLPKFGLTTQSSTEEIPSFDKGTKIGGGETTGLEEVLTVTTEGPSIEIKGTSVDLSTEGSDLEGKGRKFKLPSLSFSVPQAKEPETDLSLRTDVEVKVPQVKAEIKLPSNKSSVEMETKALETKDTKKTTEGSPSKFKMPNFKLPKFGLATQTSTGEVPPLDKGVKPVEGKITTSEEVIVVTTEAPTIEIKGPLLELKTEGIDREEKGKKFKLPSLGFSATEAKGTSSGLSKTEVDVTLPEVKAEVKLPDEENLIKTSSAIEIKGPEIKTVTKDADGSPSKFKMPGFKLPKFGLTTQSSTEEGPPLEKDEEDSEPKNTVTTIDTKATEIMVVSKDTDGSPSKFKMPAFKLPKFGLATQSSNKQVQDAKTVKGESSTLEEVLTVTTEEPSIKIKGPSVDLRSSETDDERKGSKFKLPSLGFSLSQSKGPDTNIRLPKADVDVTAPEVKAEIQFSDVKVEQPSGQMDIKSPEIEAVIDTTSEVKMPTITLPKLGAVTPHVSMEIPKMTKEKRGDVDLHVDTDPVDLNVKEGELKKYEVQLPGSEAKGEDEPTVELEGKVKRLNWTFPSISFSRTGGKASEVDVNMEAPKAGVTSMETKISDIDVKKSSMVPAVEATPAPELDPGLKKSKFSLPKFSFSKPSLKEPEVKADLPDHRIEVKNYETDMTTEIKLSADEDKYVLTAFEMTTSEAEVKSKKFKMPTLKMPRFGSASYEATAETHISDKTADDDGSQLGEGAAVIIKGPKIDFKSDAPKSEQPDQETLNTESDGAVQGSPSKFKLPTFKIPRLGVSRSKPEDESVHFEHENIEDQLEMKTEPKEENLSPKLTLTSFGDILKSIDVDFDVRKVDKVDQDVETSKESHEPGEPTTMHTAAKTKHDTTKGSESSSWFKFPKFGLSSPTEQQKIPDKAEQVKDGSPVGETKDEEVSPTLSVQSSDAFADVSSTITSEPVDPFIPSPTKVTVKYSDESAGTGLEEIHSDIMTSTTRTELITDVPSLPEKITILSSGVSSSSEDTVRLTSGKIHIITSNIQPTPESQHAKILSAVQVQSAEGFALQSERDEAPSWMVQDVQSATRTVKHLVQETTTERSENKETVVITKQITHIFGPTEPISGETASSIQRLKDSVHTEKMRFFDEAEK
ncbi:neuroblast differentiation-associated protein AHNAK isoform X2 [Poecilia reticulata]|uniref:neuroblast differentiation-associated protein AHNAK isoform X2 n=1 Tax=Poecilia reticulata TaxID=8081 RepID=UPI0004A24ECB|nr:PREDICTED: neuroblast differentiation-associated protein AHNAK-like isoform X2 [Poecilia reticulata]